MRKLMALLLLITMPFLQGCAIGILAAGVGAGIGMGRSGTAKMMKAKGEYTEKYNNYRVELEKINLEREKSGLKPINIPTFDEWLDTQPLTASEIKLFKKYKVSTTAELKEQEKTTSETQPATTEPKTNITP